MFRVAISPVCRVSTLRLLPVFLCLTWFPCQAEEEVDPTLLQLAHDRVTLESAISQGDLASAWIESGSLIYQWKSYPDFFEITDAIQTQYEFLPKPLLESELVRRSAVLGDNPCGFMCLDTGLIALASGQVAKAAESFEKTLKDPDFADSPFAQALLGRALLEQGQIHEATQAYIQSITMAERSGDPSVLFRLRHLYADDLFSKGRVAEAVEVATACLKSACGVERAWVLAKLVELAWSRKNFDEAIKWYAELKVLFPTVRIRLDLPWQQRRYEQAKKTMEWFEGAVTEDSLKKLILDVEALDFDYQQGRVMEAEQRMSSWIKAYPLSAFNTIKDATLQEWITWAHYNYSAVLCILGRYEEAASGFEELIAALPTDRFGARLVDSWCWLGHVLRCQGKLNEAKIAFETGLVLDTSSQEGFEVSTEALSQPRIKQGLVEGKQRAAYVQEYQRLQEQLLAQGGAN